MSFVGRELSKIERVGPKWFLKNKHETRPCGSLPINYANGNIFAAFELRESLIDIMCTKGLQKIYVYIKLSLKSTCSHISDEVIIEKKIIWKAQSNILWKWLFKKKINASFKYLYIKKRKVILAEYSNFAVCNVQMADMQIPYQSDGIYL